MSFTEAGNTLLKNAKAIEQTIEECAKIAMDPNLSDDEKIIQVEEKFSNRGQSASNAYNQEAERQAKEAATKVLTNGGWSPEAIEKWFQTHWRQFTDPENLRKTKENAKQKVETVEKVAKFGWGKLLVACVALFAVILVVMPKPQPDPLLNVIAEEEARRQQLESIRVTTDQLNIMFGGMVVPSAPVPVADLPAPVAAVADVPVIVERINPGESEPRTYTSTVGQVYVNSPPQAQRRIEQDAPKIEHDYDRPSQSACNDCLNQHRDEWNRHINELNEQRRHKSYSVTMGDGSSTIGVNY